jgi:hypothetical protein
MRSSIRLSLFVSCQLNGAQSKSQRGAGQDPSDSCFKSEKYMYTSRTK